MRSVRAHGAPELPDALKESGESPEMPGAYVYDAGNCEGTLWLADTGNRGYSIGGRDVTGFYMQGYGYLFTVKWRVTPVGNHFRYWDTAAERVMEEGTEEQRQAYTEHLAELKEKTAEILATYGPTLTGLNDDDWVGVFYNVGSAAGLLEGGISSFLVQARMGDVRQAGNHQPDGAAWLLGRLVTKEKQD